MTKRAPAKLPAQVYVVIEKDDYDNPHLFVYTNLDEIPMEDEGAAVGAYTLIGEGMLKVTREIATK